MVVLTKLAETHQVDCAQTVPSGWSVMAQTVFVPVVTCPDKTQQSHSIHTHLLYRD